MPTDWTALADSVLDGTALSRDDALRVATAPDDELLAILHAAFRIRREHHGREVRVHVLQNAKSGVCAEDCAFCSQSMHFESEVPQYGMQSVDELVEGAAEAKEMGAVTFCIVTATRGPASSEVETVCEAARRIKDRWSMGVCASLGLLKEGQAEQLAEAGVDRYNHNLETSEDHFSNIVQTHDWQDRVRTVQRAKAAGMEACCGGIVGMREAAEDRVDLALALRDIGVESVPINLLNPRPGTPMEAVDPLSPPEALKTLALFRFVHPAADVRIAGGREEILQEMQPLALYAANSMFTDGYLTTPGQEDSEDHRMIKQAGFTPAVVGEQSAACAGDKVEA